MAVSFLDMEIYKTTIIYYSAMLSLVFGLMKSSHKIIKFSALGVMILHVIYLVSRISTIKYGLFVVIDRYLSGANQLTQLLVFSLVGFLLSTTHILRQIFSYCL